MLIYKITNRITGKIYVGLTTMSLSDRWNDHKSCSRNPAKYTSALYCSMRKHGVENFTIEVIDTAATLEELNIKERTYIKAFNTLVPNGYNLDNGGGAQNCHPETRKKISKTLKGREFKNRMNGAPKGRPVSEERRKRISETMKGVAQPWKYKAVTTPESGVVYESVNHAAAALGIGRTIISQLLKSGKTHKKTGLSFKFV